MLWSLDLYDIDVWIMLHVNTWFISLGISEVISLLIKNKRFSAVLYSHRLVFKSLSVFSLFSFLTAPSSQYSFRDPL